MPWGLVKVSKWPGMQHLENLSSLFVQSKAVVGEICLSGRPHWNEARRLILDSDNTQFDAISSMSEGWTDVSGNFKRPRNENHRSCCCCALYVL